VLQGYFGYCQKAKLQLKKFLFLVGSGNNGKSVVLAMPTLWVIRANWNASIKVD
jgi:hypothetical protein